LQYGVAGLTAVHVWDVEVAPSALQVLNVVPLHDFVPGQQTGFVAEQAPYTPLVHVCVPIAPHLFGPHDFLLPSQHVWPAPSPHGTLQIPPWQLRPAAQAGVAIWQQA
jgi:hypothetical protein